MISHSDLRANVLFLFLCSHKLQFQMYKEKMAALTAEKDALQLELETKTKELEEAQRLLLEYTDNRTRLK